MNRSQLLPLLLLALAVGGYFLFADSHEAEPIDLDPNGGVEKAATPGGLVGKVRGPDAVGDLERDQLEDAGAEHAGEPLAYREALSGVRGRLIWAGSRKPIEGVEVKIAELFMDAFVPSLDAILGMEDAAKPVVFKGTTRSGKDGEFIIRGVHSRAIMFLAIGFSTDKAAFRLVDRAPAPGELVDLGDVELLERGVVTGQVIDDAGDPVVGARVRIADLPKIAFQFGAEQFDPEGMVLYAVGAYRTVVHFPPWLQEYDKILPFGDGMTGADGRFRIAGVRPGHPSVWVTKPDLAPFVRSVPVVSLQENDVGRLTMREGEYLGGRFVDSDGKPVTTVRVTAGAVLPVVPVGVLRRPVAVDGKGRFEMLGLPKNQLYLCYQRRKGQPWEVRGPYRGDDDVEIVLGALRTGELHLTRTDGQREIEEVSFSLHRANQTDFVPGLQKVISGKGHVKADPERENVYKVYDLPEGLYRVIARAKGLSPAATVLNLKKKSKSREARIEFEPALRLRFEVVDAQDRPVEAARIFQSPPKKSEMARRDFMRTPLLLGKTDAEGVLDCDRVVPATMEFFCRHPAFALDSFRGEKGTLPPVVRFRLGANGSLSGVLTDGGQEPEESFTVVAVPVPKLRNRYHGLVAPRFTVTAPDGTFEFSDIQPGKWKVRAVPDLGASTSPADFAKVRSKAGPSKRVTIEAASASFVAIDMHRDPEVGGPGSIVGSILISGRPAKGAWVQTRRGNRRAEVSENGTFLLKGLKNGKTRISVERAGDEGMLPNRLWDGYVTITVGELHPLSLNLQVADLTVVVVDEAGRPVSGLLLALLGKPATTASGHRGRVRIVAGTDSDGRVAFAAVPIGEYTVQSVMQRNPATVIPVVPLRLFGVGAAPVRITAIRPVTAAGTVTFDLSELREADEKAYANKLRPSYLVLESEGRFLWGPARTAADGRVTFSTSKGAPGTYRLTKGRGKSKLRWHSSPLVIPAGGVRDAVLTLRPDAEHVRAVVAKTRPKRKPNSKPTPKDVKK